MGDPGCSARSPIGLIPKLGHLKMPMVVSNPILSADGGRLDRVPEFFSASGCNCRRSGKLVAFQRGVA